MGEDGNTSSLLNLLFIIFYDIIYIESGKEIINMFKLEDVERARRIVEMLDIPKEFGSHEDSDETNDEISEQLEDVINGDYFVSNGVSKLVIIVDDLPFVIKIPFNGRWVYNDDEEGYEDEYFYEFTQADDMFGNNYCYCELEKTREVEEVGFGYFVPDMMYLCTVCGRDIYIQEKVTPICECRGKISPSADSLERAKKVRSPFTDNWIALVIDLYGENALNEFMQWARMYDNEILSDMHSGNYGIDMNGYPKLLDLSGFRD